MGRDAQGLHAPNDLSALGNVVVLGDFVSFA